MSETTNVYGLYCPVRDCLFYIGKSVDPVARYDSHMNRARAAAMNCSFPHLYESPGSSFYSDARTCWIAWLVQQDKIPELVVLQQVERDAGDGREEERSWIVKMCEAGHPLTNIHGMPRRYEEPDLQRAIQRGRDLFDSEADTP